MFGFNFSSHEEGFSRDFRELRREQFSHRDRRNLAEITEKTLRVD